MIFLTLPTNGKPIFNITKGNLPGKIVLDCQFVKGLDIELDTN